MAITLQSLGIERLRMEDQLALLDQSWESITDFVTSVIAHASDFDRPESTLGPFCFKCRTRDNRRVDTGMTDDDAVVWHCPASGTEGHISNWQGTFFDLSQGMPSG